MAAVMITTRDDGRTLLMIALEPENIRRIKAGNPYFHGGRPEYGFPLSAVDVVIFEATPDEIQEQIKRGEFTVGRTIDERRGGGEAKDG